MGITIKTADLLADRQVMMDTLLRNRERYDADEAFRARYDWAYLHNPDGEATAWLAIDDKSEKVVGFTSAFPRRMAVNGNTTTAWNCADFSIDKEFRTLGVAIKLRRAAKDAVDSGQMPFLYAHPNERMFVIHQKVGHQAIGQMKRYATLLRLEKRLLKFLPMPLAYMAGTVANPILRFGQPQPRLRDKTLQFAYAARQPFGEEFTEFYEEVKRHFPVSGYRDARYLTWRFLENPYYQLDTLKVYRKGKLRGYCIFGDVGGIAHIADLLVTDEEPVFESLLHQLFKLLRRKRVCTLSIKLHESNVLLPGLQRFGFRERDDATSNVVSYAPSGSELAKTVLIPQNWFMTVGDRDI